MQIPGYTIIQEINTGGMATIFLATQNSVGRKVALKIMDPKLDADPEFHQRFQREANIVGQLSQRNIIPIYDIGRHQGLNYISMEFMPNGSLEDKIKQGINVEQALYITTHIAAALEHAHSKGYVHRDIKPDNILFREDNSPVLTDFGIARAIKSANKMTQAGSVIGTPYYMSPEQAQGEPTDARSDLYSLGVVLYEMLTGNKLFDANSAVTLGIKHIHEPPKQLAMHLAFLQPLLNKLLAKKPDDRFQTAKELTDSLNNIAKGNPVTVDINALHKLQFLLIKSQQFLKTCYSFFSNNITGKIVAEEGFNKNTKIATQVYTPVYSKIPKYPKRFFIYASLSIVFIVAAINIDHVKNPEPTQKRWAIFSEKTIINESELPLKISTHPKKSSIRFVDLRKTYQANMLLPEGVYQIEISAPGYLTKTQWIRLNKRSSPLEITLPKQHSNNNSLVLPDMVFIKKGIFFMGDNSDDQMAQQIIINENFYMSRYEITFNEYDFFATETNRSFPDDNGWGRGDRPVINISWDDAVAYTHWLSKVTGKTYRLPTNTEWEYAARGNTTSSYWWGNNPDDAYQRANCRLGCKPWWNFFSGNKTQTVATFPPNDFGLHNTAGNVAEWTADCAVENNAPISSVCVKRVVRGGSYNSKVANITSYTKSKLSSNKFNNKIGMRVLREISSRFDDPKNDATRSRNIFQDIKNSILNPLQHHE